MIKLHELPGDPGKKTKRKRVGRGEGSGWGCTCGVGSKGQNSRSGRGKGAGFEGGQMTLIRHLPKFGFSNNRFRAYRAHITLRDLERFEDGETVDLAALRDKGLIAKKIGTVKVVANGAVTRKLTVKLDGFSAKAREAIEAAGGSCEGVS